MMSRMPLIVPAFALVLPMLCSAQDAEVESAEGPAWWHVRRPGPAEGEPGYLPLIKVDSNSLVTDGGDTVLVRGLSISDPDKIERDGYWSEAHFEKVAEMGTGMVRIPVHPQAWRRRGPAAYLELLDDAIAWSGRLGMYVVIDWHSIGNLGMELFQDPIYDTSRKETYEFWRAIARRYAGNNTVAFYELFNEPTIYRGQLGSMSWSQWREINEKLIDLIRAYDRETVPLVAGMDWAYDLSSIRVDPVRRERIGYVSHPYAFKREKPWPPKWDEAFGFAADQYPVLVTEFGFGFDPEMPDEGNAYATELINYLEGRNIGWIGWVFDPNWWPSLFESYETYELTPSGEFFEKALRGEVQ